MLAHSLKSRAYLNRIFHLMLHQHGSHLKDNQRRAVKEGAKLGVALSQQALTRFQSRSYVWTSYLNVWEWASIEFPGWFLAFQAAPVDVGHSYGNLVICMMVSFCLSIILFNISDANDLAFGGYAVSHPVRMLHIAADS